MVGIDRRRSSSAGGTLVEILWPDLLIVLVVMALLIGDEEPATAPHAAVRP